MTHKVRCFDGKDKELVGFEIFGNVETGDQALTSMAIDMAHIHNKKYYPRKKTNKIVFVKIGREKSIKV